MLAGILISPDHPRQEDRGEERWQLWEHWRRGQETKGTDWGSTGPRATLCVPDLNIQHQIKCLLMRPWVAVSGYGIEQIHMVGRTYQISPSHLVL